MVEGEISPFGYSNLYLRQDNPFREGEKEAFLWLVKRWEKFTSGHHVRLPTQPTRDEKTGEV